MQETVYAFGIFILFFLVGFADGFLEFLMRLHAKLCSTGDGMPRAQVCVCYYYLYLFFSSHISVFCLTAICQLRFAVNAQKTKKNKKKIKEEPNTLYQVLCFFELL